VNGNAEALRDKFVDFDGKKTLEIKMGGTLFNSDFGTFAKRMVDEQICMRYHQRPRCDKMAFTKFHHDNK